MATKKQATPKPCITLQFHNRHWMDALGDRIGLFVLERRGDDDDWFIVADIRNVRNPATSAPAEPIVASPDETLADVLVRVSKAASAEFRRELWKAAGEGRVVLAKGQAARTFADITQTFNPAEQVRDLAADKADLERLLDHTNRELTAARSALAAATKPVTVKVGNVTIVVTPGEGNG
jgi:hypothetical protein